MKNNANEIRSLADLQIEKNLLRGQIKEQELVLQTHYKSLKQKIQPAINIASFLGGKKWFSGDSEKDPDDKNDWFNIAFKIASAAVAGGFILKKSKKNLFKTLLAYGLDQSIKYVTQIDISEHLDKIKEWLASRDEKKNSDSETTSS